MNKFFYNDETHAWERVDRTQDYKGVKIETITYHNDYDFAENHREYRVTYPSGRVAHFPINKRAGGNIKDLKAYIDFKIKYNKAQ